MLIIHNGNNGSISSFDDRHVTGTEVYKNIFIIMGPGGNMYRCYLDSNEDAKDAMQYYYRCLRSGDLDYNVIEGKQR